MAGSESGSGQRRSLVCVPDYANSLPVVARSPCQSGLPSSTGSCQVGPPTSPWPKRPRCSISLTNGSVVDCGRSAGKSGSATPQGAATSVPSVFQTSRLAYGRPAGRATGGSQAPLRSVGPCRPATGPILVWCRSAFVSVVFGSTGEPPDADLHVRWCGRGRVDLGPSPINRHTARSTCCIRGVYLAPRTRAAGSAETAGGFMEKDRAARPAPSLAPEHDWTAASQLIRPALRPKGTSGSDGRNLRVPTGNAGPGKPLVKSGPADLAIVYVLPGKGFDVVVGVDHLLAWGVGPDEIHEAAIANLGAWSGEASWVDEIDGRRRVVWSDLGEGLDAARILLEDVRERLAADLGPGCRILIGLPERDLLIAAGLAAGDDEFASLFADYVDRKR